MFSPQAFTTRFRGTRTRGRGRGKTEKWDSPLVFMQNSCLEDSDVGVKIGGVYNLRYADDTTLLA